MIGIGIIILCLAEWMTNSRNAFVDLLGWLLIIICFVSIVVAF